MNKREFFATTAILMSIILAFSVVGLSGFATVDTAHAACNHRWFLNGVGDWVLRDCYFSLICPLCGEVENMHIPDPQCCDGWLYFEGMSPECGWDGYWFVTCDTHGIYAQGFLEGGHRLEFVDETYPTCTEPGYRTEYCPLCGKTLIDEYPAHDHDWGGWSTVIGATCTDSGESRRACNHDASHIESMPIDPTGHDWSDWLLWDPPTCTDNGKERVFCLNDHAHEDFRIVPAHGHDWGDWVTTTQPTVHSEGEETCLCRYDNAHQQTRPIPKNQGVTITFVDWNGTVLHTELVEIGGTCTTPNNPLRIGFRFTNWDQDYSAVYEDLIVTALYEPIIDPDPDPDPDKPKVSEETTKTPKPAAPSNTPIGKGAPKLGFSDSVAVMLYGAALLGSVGLTVLACEVNDRTRGKVRG